MPATAYPVVFYPKMPHKTIGCHNDFAILSVNFVQILQHHASLLIKFG